MSDMGQLAAAPNNSMPNIPATSPITPIEHRNEPHFGGYPSTNPMPTPNMNNPPMPSGNSGPDAVAPANKVPSLQSNMFKMQRNKSKCSFDCMSSENLFMQIFHFFKNRIALKNSYVDVFKSSGVVKSEAPLLAPTMPTAAPPTNFFVPGAPAAQPNVC